MKPTCLLAAGCLLVLSAAPSPAKALALSPARPPKALARPPKALARPPKVSARPTKAASRIRQKPVNDPFLDEVQRRAFLFFWKNADPKTGLVKDRAKNFATDDYDVGSIASTGFGLSALCIAAERGWVPREAARQRALATLRFFDTRVDQRHGLFAHFVGLSTGKRAWNSEYSSIDTALFLAGALTAGEYFGGEVRTLARRRADAIDWNYWRPRHFICHGSRPPEQGEFLPVDYGAYSEALLLYILAIGSPAHPVPASLWDELGRGFARYGPYSSIAGSSLFVNQYPNLWFDFRGRHDRFADYWENARVNTLANRLYCINHGAEYKGFGPDTWGLTAGDGPDGYRAWAAEPGGAFTDGTINPHAAGGSYMFTPAESDRALRAIKARYGSKVWGKYGFSDGFNVGKNWYDTDVIGIDTGATLLSIENERTGLITRLFMRTPEARNALKRIAFRANPAPKPAVIRLDMVSAPAGKVTTIAYDLDRLRDRRTAAPLVLYGGVVTAPMRLTLNGRELARFTPQDGRPNNPAFPIPAGLLRWTGPNRLEIEITPPNGASATYGPLWIAPRETVDDRPLVVK